MFRSRPIQLIKTFSAKELNSLHAFLQFQEGPTSDYNLSLFQEIRKYAPRFEHPRLEKNVFLKNWPAKEKWTVKKLSYQLNYLTNSIEQFLGWQEYQQHEWRQYIDMFTIGHQRSIPFLIQKARKKLEKWLHEYPYKDRHYFTRLLEWRQLQYQLMSIDAARNENSYLQAVSTTLDQFFAIGKIQQLWEMRNVEKMLRYEYDHGFGAHLQAWPIGQSIQGLIKPYILALKLLDSYENKAAYFELKEMLLTNAVLLPTIELKQFYTSLLNFCTHRVNALADEDFRREYFEINKTLLEKGWLLHKGILSPWRYINLVTNGLVLGETIWVWNFIQKNRQCLPKGIRKNAFQYACGLYYYQQQSYDDAQRALAKVSFEEPLFNAGVRILLAKVYFDANETVLLENQLQANRLFLLRDKTIDITRKAQLQHFNTLLIKLTKLAPFDKEGHQILLNEMPPSNEVVFRSWLIDRIKNNTN